MFRFLHAADIHLDSPLKGLDRYEGAPVEKLRGATRKAFDSLVQTAIEQKVNFVVIAGDLYDGDWRDFQTGLYFNRKAAQLADENIKIYMIAGNHDAANKMTRSLRFPPNVTMLATDKAQTVFVPELDVAIHGQGFASAAVTDDISLSYPHADRAAFNIGLLHTCASGRDGHERYAPCTVEGLKLKGYDYWALGHIHLRETLCEEPHIAFSGNIQGRHIRETGPKGCLIVEVQNDRSVVTSFEPLDVLRWNRLIINLEDIGDESELLTALESEFHRLVTESSEKSLAVRIELKNATSIHRDLIANLEQTKEEIRSVATRISSEELWIEKINVQSAPEKEASTLLTLPDDAIGELTSIFQEAIADPNVRKELFSFVDIANKFPDELRAILRTNDPDWIQSVLREAESRLLEGLLPKGGHE